MRLTQLFVNRPTLVFVIVALVALVGIFSLATLVQQQFPNIDFPTINVSASYPGASPSELRDAVVRPLEDAIAGAPDLDHINTTIQQNQASISATFTLDSNQTTDLTEVQDRIQTAQRRPAGRSPRTVGAHVRPRAGHHRHPVGHLAVAERVPAVGDRHQ
jgi:HAE1 family hydrophobic/amphiphilic exporter-1